MANHTLISTPTGRQRSIGVHNVGLSVALLFGGVHVAWALLVASGLAQTVLNFVFWLHFIGSGWVVESFEFGRAAGLVAMTSAIGYAVGAIFAIIWTNLHRASL